MHIRLGSVTQPAKIKVLGIGGAGTLALQTLIQSDSYTGIDYIAIHSDPKVLAQSMAQTKIDLSTIHESPLSENQKQEIFKALNGADIIFILCGQGRMFSSNFAPIIANIARSTGAITLAITTKPFGFEGKRSLERADYGIEELTKNVDSITVLSLHQLITKDNNSSTLLTTLRFIHDALQTNIATILQIIGEPRFINIDMADIQTMLTSGGPTFIGQGISEGNSEQDIESAFQKATNSPLMETPITGATNIIITVTGSEELSLYAIEKAIDKIHKSLPVNSSIKFSVDIQKKLSNNTIVNILGSGFSKKAIFYDRCHYSRQESDDFVAPSFVRRQH